MIHKIKVALEAHWQCIVDGGAADSIEIGDGVGAGGVGGVVAGGVGGVVAGGVGGVCRKRWSAWYRDARPRPWVGEEKWVAGLGDAGGDQSSDESDPGPDPMNMAASERMPSRVRRRKTSRSLRGFELRTISIS